MTQPLLLAYNIDPFTEAKLRAVCESHGFAYRAVAPDDYAAPIGALAGIPVSKSASAPLNLAFDEPMLVMCHMLSPQLDAFLQGMRKAGVRIPLKAVLTPVNVTWHSRQLRDELVKEHEQFQRR